MPNISAEAIEIITDDGTGFPVSVSDTSIGLSSGHFYWTSGRFNFDGSKTVTGDTNRTIWFDNILTNDSITCSRRSDFIESGDISSMSSLSLGVINTPSVTDKLASYNIRLSRCKVIYYYLTSSDGLSFKFSERWQGVIENHPYNETVLNIQCIDNQKDLFSSSPFTSVSTTTFPFSTRQNSGKQIPIAIGRVAFSPMVNVSGLNTKIALVNDNNVTSYICSLTDFSVANRTITLKANVPFSKNDYRLVGSHLSVISGGPSQSRRIRSNTATSGFTVVITIDEFFDVSSVQGKIPKWSINSTKDDIWYFEVTKYTSTLIASTKPINQFVYDNQLPYLFTYDTNSQAYQDVAEIQILSNPSKIDVYNYPGFIVKSITLDTQGNLDVYFPIKPYKVEFLQAQSVRLDIPSLYNPHITAVDAPYLYDGNQGTYYLTSLVNSFNPGNTARLVFRVTFPSNVLKNWDDIYLLPNIRTGIGTSLVRLKSSIKPLDIYFRPLATSTPSVFHNDQTDGFLAYTLPSSYFNTAGDDSTFYTAKTGLSVRTVIDNYKKALTYNSFWFYLDVDCLASGSDATLQLQIFEFGFTGKKSVSFSSDVSYCSLIGENYSTTWEGRKSPSAPVLLLGDATEHLIRNYAYPYPTWTPGVLYNKYDRVRSTADNGHYFTCLIAGISDSTEPTFPATSGGTVTESGGVSWKEVGEFKIDTSSFDLFSTQRNNWFVGRTLTESNSVESYLKEMSNQGFFGLATNRFGEVYIKSWLDNDTPLITFNSSNTIYNSLGTMNLSPIRRVFNDIKLEYDHNPAANTYNKQIFITHVDRSAFPAITDTTNNYPPVNLLNFTVSYASAGGGIYKYTAITNAPHNLASGDYVSLTGNIHNFNFSPLPVSVLDSASFVVNVQNQIPLVSSSTSGTLVKTINVFRWTEYVGGIKDYALAKELWTICHNSYLVSKVVNKLPENLSKLKWTIDPDAIDPAQNYFWHKDLHNSVPNIDVGDANPVIFYLLNYLLRWTPWQKYQTTIKVDKTILMDDGITSVLDLKLYDCVNFSDPKLTNGSNLLGWVHEVTDLPASGKSPELLQIGITFNPINVPLPCNNLIDSPTFSDTLTDKPKEADSITDKPC